MSAERSVIRNRSRAKQLLAFNDLVRMRNISPTDLDALIDYNGNAFLYLEGKVKGKTIDRGQKLALEHLVDSHWRAKNPAAVLLFAHEVPVEMDVMVAYQFVDMVYCRQQIPCLCGRRYQAADHGATNWWFPQTAHITIKSAIGFFEEAFKAYGL